MRIDLALEEEANNTCLVTTDIFSKTTIKEQGNQSPYWRLVDDRHPVVKKLQLNVEEIKNKAVDAN